MVIEQSQPALEELTGFLTRKSFEARLAELQEESDAKNIALIAVQISRFGVVNDSVGSGTGDKIIATTAKRLSKLFPHAVAIGRLHGDHFGILFDDPSLIADEVERLLDFAQRPLALRGEVIVLSIRIGVAESANIDDPRGELVHAAEVALHHAKSSKAKVAYFDGLMIDKARSVHQLENDLRVSLVTNAAELHQAISNSEFELYYQPIVSCVTHHIHAFEALLRWHHPTRGLVSPALFIPMAEQIHVMSVLGSWIVRKACADAVTWPANSSGMLPSVSVNVSPTQFYEPEVFFRALQQAISESGIEPSRVKIEVTESADFAPTMRSYLEKIRTLGCTVALDDFGTGFSSIAQLVDLPLDYVKIDRSLVVDLESEDLVLAKRAEKIAISVLRLADSLELEAIVEGIETYMGVNKIRDLGADLIQGFAYSKPVPLNEINNLFDYINKGVNK